MATPFVSAVCCSTKCIRFAALPPVRVQCAVTLRAGETVFVESSTRVEKSAGNEFKIYGLLGSGGENKE